MNRQNYQQIGFIIALVIAGVSLPTSIISLTREPNITHDYYNDAYYNQTYYNQTYYNQTYNDAYYNQSYYNQTYNYGNNETEIFTLPLQIWEFFDVENDETFHIVNYTLDCKNWLYISGNETGDQSIQITIYFVNWVNIDNRYFAQFELTSGAQIKSWSPNISGEFMITFRSYAIATRDLKIYFEIGIGD
jgi:hypothetical protein